MEKELEVQEPTQEVLDDIHEEAAEQAGVSDGSAFGRPGKPFDRSSPFLIGLLGALGVACAYALAWAVVAAGQVLVLLALAFVVAVGLDPAVVWLARRGLPRGLAAALVLVVVAAIAGFFLVHAVPVVTSQAATLAHELPHYLKSLRNPHTALGKLNAKYHIVSSLQSLVKGSGTFTSALGLGEVLLGFIASAVLVAVVSIYLLADLPRVKRALYLVAPKSRRARMVLLTDEIFSRVGGYVLGNVLLSVIAGVLTGVWALLLGIPYALLLGLLVALLDLIPVVGSTIGGIIVSLIALTVSLSVAIATAVFYVFYRFLEDYVLTPRIMMRTVDVPGLVTVIATVIGGVLLGIIGALVAIPVAAAIKLLLQEIAAPRLDES
jgi:predicted PurR-regulated permease PerM